jgi:DNA repair exonuclease SbcCD ATPase subunit
MLTLVKAVSRWMRVPGVCGLLVLDEVFGFLDASGAEGLVEALREVQEVIPAIFVVTHDAQLQALFSQVLVVEQDAQGVSRLQSGPGSPRTVDPLAGEPEAPDLVSALPGGD